MLITEYAIGVDIAPDRQHTTIMGCGMTRSFLHIKVLERLSGSNTAEKVIEFIRKHQSKVVAVVVDPEGPAVSLVRPLRDAGLASYYELTRHNCTEAHVLMLDALYDDKLRHDRDPVLDEAMQFANVRLLGGVETLDRRHAKVDISPLTAAQCALFGFVTRPGPPMPAIYGHPTR